MGFGVVVGGGGGGVGDQFSVFLGGADAVVEAGGGFDAAGVEGHEAGEGAGGVVCGIAGAFAFGRGGFGIDGGGFGGFGGGEGFCEGCGREVGGGFVLGFVSFVFVRHGEVVELGWCAVRYP